ncbi:MAG: flavodoxin-dependent (E)-4-hydroxy-3-methylbut-2-enyl-diphosphate synthase, partial [Pseudomonadota bacterium]
CVVNGPGEARETDIGFTGGGSEAGMLYLGGVPAEKLKNDDMIDKLVKLCEDKAAEVEAALVAAE